MFEIRLSCGYDDLDKVCLKCINCKKETGLKSKTGFKEFYNKSITQFLLNAMLHHVGMSCIISSKQEMDYDNFTNIKNLSWFDTGPWHKKISVLNYMEPLLKDLLHRLEQTYTILCVL